jgi:hypothetical protein
LQRLIFISAHVITNRQNAQKIKHAIWQPEVESEGPIMSLYVMFPRRVLTIDPVAPATSDDGPTIRPEIPVVGRDSRMRRWV